MHSRLPLLLGALIALSACGDGDPRPAGGPDPAPRPPRVVFPTTTAHQVGVPLGPALVTGAVDEGCGDCHAEIVEAYAGSGMHEALTLPTGAGSPEARHAGADIVHPKTGVRVRFDAIDGRYIQTLLYVDPGGVERVRYHMPADLVIGSGAAGRGYLGVAGDALFVLPLSWYREIDALEISPGPGFQGVSTRAATTLCIQCHTGDAQPADPRSQFGFSGEISLGVGCSRCHGDGTAHAESGDPRDVLNPARLPIERQSELCYQCHFSGAEQFFVPGKDLSKHRPDRPLAETMSVFVPVSGWTDSGAAVAGHVVRLHRSKCFTESDGLTCTTCHNPHRPAGEDSEGCAICHADAADHSAAGTGPRAAAPACAEEHGARGERTCASCHMARVDSSDIQHTRTTDHWIRRRPTPPEFAGRAPEEGRLSAHALRNEDLVDVLDPEGRQPHARLLLAHAFLTGVEAANTSYAQPAPEYLARAAELLDELLAESPGDVEVLWRRARAYRLAGTPGPGIPLLDRALVAAPDHPSAIAERGLCALAAGDADGAAQWLRRAAQRTPDDLTVIHGLSQAYERAGNPRDAVAALQLSRARGGPRVDIADVGVRLALRHGLLADALAFSFDRLAFRPRDPVALAETGEILRALGRGAEARPFYAAALEIDGRTVAALLGLSELEGAAGRPSRAQELRESARRIAPDHPTFRRR